MWSVRGRPYFGERVSGDAHCIRLTKDLASFVVIDVLGHGRKAFEATRVMLTALNGASSTVPEKNLALCNRELLKIRNAASMTAITLDAEGRMNYASIGNITTIVFSEEIHTLPNKGGSVGLRYRSPITCSLQLRVGSRVLIHTDGISCRPLDRKSIAGRVQPQQLTDFLLREHASRTDDNLCLALRYVNHRAA